MLQRGLVCPPGFRHDFTVAHFPNCGLADYALSVFFGLLTALTLAGLLVTLHIYSRMRSGAKRISRNGMLQSVFNWLLVLSVWIEQGHFQAASVLLFISSVISTRLLIDGTMILCAPVYAMLSRGTDTLRRILIFVECFSAILQLICTVLLIVYSRDADPSRFNSVTVVYQFIFTSTVTFAAGCIVVSTTILISKAKRYVSNFQQNIERFQAFITRFNRLKILVVVGFFFCCLVLVFPITTLVLGSFPYQFILFCFIHGGVPLFQIGGVISFGMEGSSLAFGESGASKTASRPPSRTEVSIVRGNSLGANKASSKRMVVQQHKSGIMQVDAN